MNLTSIFHGSDDGASTNSATRWAPGTPSSAARCSAWCWTRGTTWVGSATSMATRGIDDAPTISSVFVKSGERGGGNCAGGGGKDRDVSQTSPDEGITPGQAAAAWRAHGARRRPACLPGRG